MSNIFTTIESDITAVWGAVEGAVETAVSDLWGLVKGVVSSVESAALSQIVKEVEGILSGADTIPKALDDLETFVLNELKSNESVILGDIEKVGSTLFQAILGLIVSKL